MNDNILPFGKQVDFPDKGLVHVSELIIYRHMLDTACLGGDRELLVSPDGMRKIHSLPTVQEATMAISPIIASDETNKILDGVLKAENDVADEEPKTHFSVDDKVTQIVPSGGRTTNQKIQMAMMMMIRQNLNDIIYQALDLQYPVLEEMDFYETSSALQQIRLCENYDDTETQERIRVLRQETIKSLKDKILDASQRQFGSPWVEVKENPDLYETVQMQLSIIKNGFVFPENNA